MSGSFRRQWLLLNAGAFSLGYLVYTPIAHGITGKHVGLHLTLAQLAAHVVALVVVAVLVGSAQRHVLLPLVPVTRRRIVAAAVVVNVAFWFLWYQPWIDPGNRFLVNSLLLGSCIWVGSLPTKGHRVAAAVALVSFPLASLVGILCFVLALELLKIPMTVETSDVQHAAFYTTYGVVTGVLGGWLSGLALARCLPVRHHLGAAQLLAEP